MSTETNTEETCYKYSWTSDGCTCYAKASDKLETIKIKAGEGYSRICGEKTLLKLKDTGNGFIAKIPSFSSCYQDNYICLDYAEAEYLMYALEVWYKEHKAKTDV